MVMLKQNLKSETLKKKTSSRTTPYASAWNLIIKHISTTRRWRLCLKLEQQSLDQHWRSEIGPIGSELVTSTKRERESSVYATPIGSKIATPQGILHFASLFSLFFSLNLWVLLWTVVWTVVWDWEREKVLSFFLNWFSLFKSL